MTGPGGRPARKRVFKDTPTPEFRLMPGDVKIYMLRVPTDSPLKIVPPGVHPTIRIEGNHVAFATSSDAARTALETIKKTGNPGRMSSRYSLTFDQGRSFWRWPTRERPCPACWPACRERA